MTMLGESDQRRIGDRVYCCEKHGVLNRPLNTSDTISEIAKYPRRLRSE
jgi:hypothetical protein